MSRINLILVLSFLILGGCGQKKAEQFTALPFPDITLPAMIQTQQDAAEGAEDVAQMEFKEKTETKNNS